MTKKLNKAVGILTIITFFGCATKIVSLTKGNLSLVNREILTVGDNALSLNAQEEAGLAIIEEQEFDSGSIEIELKGEDRRGRSFVGIAFNVQNDSTYEAVYFRPFNFKAEEQIRREHSVQYIFHPKNTWRYLRTNFEGQYEAEFPRQPDPNDWFAVKIEVSNDRVSVYDKATNSQLLSVQRLTTQKANKIGLWTGNNSKGEFRNLKLSK